MKAQIQLSGNKIFWKEFCWGQILLQKSTFLLVPRLQKNVFQYYGPSLCINSEALKLLDKLNIKFIEGTFCGKPFRVPVKRWIESGRISPFKSDVVDTQTALGLTDIFSDENDRSQLSLFGRL
jgi:hypothetical protein